VRVLSPTGKTLRQVASKAPCTTGRNTLVWDGTNQQGAVVPSGIVLIDIVGTDPDGASVRVTRPVMLTR